jgi:hypothetical protein
MKCSAGKKKKTMIMSAVSFFVWEPLRTVRKYTGHCHYVCVCVSVREHVNIFSY